MIRDYLKIVLLFIVLFIFVVATTYWLKESLTDFKAEKVPVTYNLV